MNEQDAIIYVIDDDDAMRRSLIYLLDSAGWQTRPFASGREFLDQYDGHVPGCLILDVHLPGASGLELQQRLLEQGRHVPTLFITAFEGAASRQAALDSGALAFLQEPLDNERLLEVLRVVLEMEEENGS